MRSKKLITIIVGISIFVSGCFYRELYNFMNSSRTLDGAICIIVFVIAYAIFHLKCELVKYKEKYYASENIQNHKDNIYIKIGEIKSELHDIKQSQSQIINELMK